MARRPSYRTASIGLELASLGDCAAALAIKAPSRERELSERSKSKKARRVAGEADYLSSLVTPMVPRCWYWCIMLLLRRLVANSARSQAE